LVLSFRVLCLGMPPARVEQDSADHQFLKCFVLECRWPVSVEDPGIGSAVEGF